MIEEIGCKPNVNIVNRLIMRARIFPGDMICITPRPVVSTNGAPRLIKNIAAMESGSQRDCDNRNKDKPIQIAAALTIKPIRLAAWDRGSRKIVEINAPAPEAADSKPNVC